MAYAPGLWPISAAEGVLVRTACHFILGAIIFFLTQPSRAAAGSPATLARLDDPVCSITNALPRTRSAGTLRMIERLKRFRESVDPADTKFLNDRLVTVLQQAVRETADPRQRTGLRMRLGREWVNSGRPLEGLREFDAVEESLKEMKARLGPKGEVEMRMSRAVG